MRPCMRLNILAQTDNMQILIKLHLIKTDFKLLLGRAETFKIMHESSRICFLMITQFGAIKFRNKLMDFGCRYRGEGNTIYIIEYTHCMVINRK